MFARSGKNRVDGKSGSTCGWDSICRYSDVVPARFAPINRKSGNGRSGALNIPAALTSVRPPVRSHALSAREVTVGLDQPVTVTATEAVLAERLPAASRAWTWKYQVRAVSPVTVAVGPGTWAPSTPFCQTA